MNNNESKKFDLKDLDEKDINLILTGLAQLPYVKSAEMINRITLSFNSQDPQPIKKVKKKNE